MIGVDLLFVQFRTVSYGDKIFWREMTWIINMGAVVLTDPLEHASS